MSERKLERKLVEAVKMMQWWGDYLDQLRLDQVPKYVIIPLY